MSWILDDGVVFIIDLMPLMMVHSDVMDMFMVFCFIYLLIMDGGIILVVLLVHGLYDVLIMRLPYVRVP